MMFFLSLLGLPISMGMRRKAREAVRHADGEHLQPGDEPDDDHPDVANRSLLGQQRGPAGSPSVHAKSGVLHADALQVVVIS